MTDITPPTLAWAIVSGEYSDYKVHAIFSTEEQAHEQMDLWGGDEVQEFPFDDFLPKPPEGMKAWKVLRVLRDRNEEALVCISSTAEDIRKYGNKVNNDNFIWSHRTCLWARDEQHAIKIASERFFQYDAQQAGIA